MIRAYRNGSTNRGNCREVRRSLHSVVLLSTFARIICTISRGNVSNIVGVVVESGGLIDNLLYREIIIIQTEGC